MIPFCRKVRLIICCILLLRTIGSDADSLIAILLRIELNKAQSIRREIDTVIPVDVDAGIIRIAETNCPQVAAIRERDHESRVIFFCRIVCLVWRTEGEAFLSLLLSLQEAHLRLSELQWMIDHGYSLEDLVQNLESMILEDENESGVRTDLPSLFRDWEYGLGFDGAIWPCFEEFLENEYPMILEKERE